MTRLKHVLRLQYGSALAAESRETGDIPVYGSNGQVGTHNQSNMCSPAIVVGRKGSHGKVVWADRGGFCIDTALFVDRRFTSLRLRYAFYLLQTLGLDRPSKDSAVPGLDRVEAHNKEIPSLPPAAQQVIADFLDRETARIDQLIEKKERMITVIAEERSAVISVAVTRGFGSIESLKRTGSPFLPLIPESWTIQRLKHLAVVRGGITLGRQLPDGFPTVDTPYLRVANVQAGRLNLDTVTELSATESEIRRYSLRTNDVLMTEGGDNDKLGRGVVWNGSVDPCLHQNHVFAVRSNAPELAEWISLATNSRYGRDFFYLNSKQSTNLASISKSRLEQFPIAVPQRDKRVQIQHELEARLQRCDALTTTTAITIDRLHELRSALVTAAVTGQVDVAAWGKRGETHQRLEAIEHALETEPEVATV